MKQQLLLAGIGLLLATAASAQMYRYLDENGQVVYSQKPPPAGEATLIKPPPPPPTPPAKPQAKDDAEAQAEEQPAPDEPKTAEEEALDKESQRIKETNCKAARESLKQYTDPKYGFIRTPDGRFEELTPQRRSQGRKDAEQRIKEFCN
jgi:hypothetical protein